MNSNILPDIALFAKHLAQEIDNNPQIAIREMVNGDYSAIWRAMDRWDMQKIKGIMQRRKTTLSYDIWANKH